MCALAQDFSQEQGFLERNLLQCASRTLEELLSRAPLQRRLLKRSLESGEECSSVVLEPICYDKTRFSPTWSAVMRLLPVRSSSWRNPGLKCTRLSVIF
jgi:hypothetical protein